LIFSHENFATQIHAPKLFYLFLAVGIRAQRNFYWISFFSIIYHNYLPHLIQALVRYRSRDSHLINTGAFQQ